MRSQTNTPSLYLSILFLLAACGNNQANTPTTPERFQETKTPSNHEIIAPSPTPLPTSRPYRLGPGEMLLAADSFTFPTIILTDKSFISVENGNQEIADDDLILGLSINSLSRAYPIKVLSLYEVLNDTVGNQPIIVTWCPLCFTGIVFNRTLERELTFGVSGYLFNNNLVMNDHQTNTFWSQVLGEGIRGAYKGQRLEQVPSWITTWAAWKQTHPDTLLLSAAKLGNDPQSIVDPYDGYYNSDWIGFDSKQNDTRLPPKVLVLGIRVGEQSLAYPAETVAQLGIIQDELAGLAYMLIYDVETQAAFIYSRQFNNLTLTFKYDSEVGALTDDQTNSIWDIHTGATRSGGYAGQSLESIDAMLAYWFAWSDFFPETEIFTP